MELSWNLAHTLPVISNLSGSGYVQKLVHLTFVLLSVTLIRAIYSPSMELVAILFTLSLVAGGFAYLELKKLDDRDAMRAEIQKLEARLELKLKEHQKTIDGLSISRGLGR